MSDALVEIGWLVRAFHKSVCEVERLSHDPCMTPGDFVRFAEAVGVVCLVATVPVTKPGPRAVRAVAYAVYSPGPRATELLRLAVHPAFRRRGIGMALLKSVAERARKHGRDRVVVTLRDSQLDGHLFLKAAGGRAVNVLRAYHEDTGDDGYRFVLPAAVAGAAGGARARITS